MKTQLVEITVLTDDGTWENEVIAIPAEVAAKESQDAFISWVYSKDGEAFRGNWNSHVLAVYICRWDVEEEEEGL